MTNRERIVGLIGLAIIIVLVFVANAVSLTTEHQEQEEVAPKALPVTIQKEIQETEAIPFESINQEDATFETGATKIVTAGQEAMPLS